MFDSGSKELDLGFFLHPILRASFFFYLLLNEPGLSFLILLVLIHFQSRFVGNSVFCFGDFFGKKKLLCFSLSLSFFVDVFLVCKIKNKQKKNITVSIVL